MLHVDDKAGQLDFVNQLRTKVLALYTLMDAAALPWDGFMQQIRKCLMLFFIDQGTRLVSRWEDTWVTYRRAEELVPEILAKAATMRDDKARYSPDV